MKFELNLDYIDILPKFTSIEDPYLLIHKFEEVYLLIHIPRVSTNVARIRLVPFALEDNAKRWMYGPKAVSLNLGIALLISSLKGTFPLARPLDLGMKFSLLSNLNMSHVRDT